MMFCTSRDKNTWSYTLRNVTQYIGLVPRLFFFFFLRKTNVNYMQAIAEVIHIRWFISWKIVTAFIFLRMKVYQFKDFWNHFVNPLKKKCLLTFKKEPSLSLKLRWMLTFNKKSVLQSLANNSQRSVIYWLLHDSAAIWRTNVCPKNTCSSAVE